MITYVVTLENLVETLKDYIDNNGDNIIDYIEFGDPTGVTPYKIHLKDVENPHSGEVGIIEVKKRALGFKDKER